MDLAKVSALTSWDPPETRKQLLRFLGFANFYLRFIRGSSSIASALTSPKAPFRWSNEAQNSFETLKTRFTTTPILQIPEPTGSSLWRWTHPVWE